MSRVPAEGPALRLATAFVNTYDRLETPPDFLSVDLVRRLAERHGQAVLAADLARADLEQLRVLRGRLYRVYAAATAGEKVAELRALLDAEELRATLVDDDGSLRLAAVSASADPVRRLAALLADALATAMGTGGPDRLRTCVADPCRCGYVDRTRAGRQRFCCQLCNDRIAAAAYRSRRRR